MIYLLYTCNGKRITRRDLSMTRLTDKNRWISSQEFRDDREKKRLLMVLSVAVIIIVAVLGILLIVSFM
jgi:hypothetical protein